MAMFSRVIIALSLIFSLEITAQQAGCPFGYYLQTERSPFFFSYGGCLPCPPGTTGKYGVFDNLNPPVSSTNGEALLTGGTCLTCPGKMDINNFTHLVYVLNSYAVIKPIQITHYSSPFLQLLLLTDNLTPNSYNYIINSKYMNHQLDINSTGGVKSLFMTNGMSPKQGSNAITMYATTRPFLLSSIVDKLEDM